MKSTGGRSLNMMKNWTLWVCLALVSACSLLKSEGEIESPFSGEWSAVDLAPFDRLMESFIEEHQIPGAALAVARDGDVVYARGFGIADVETGRPVTPESLFRIASISKPLTALAVLKLVDQERLDLDDSILDLLYPSVMREWPVDARWKDITVRHLLQHRGGWDRDESFDPMFRSWAIVEEMNEAPPASPEMIIRYMVRRPLDFAPGQRYAYSNFGYCLLGRILELKTQMSYELGVKELLLKPIGIDDFELGRTQWKHRHWREVVYYTDPPSVASSVFNDSKVPLPYGAWCLESMDAHGGWLAAAPALLKIAARMTPKDPTFISESNYGKVVERPEGRAGWNEGERPKAAYYGLGWMVRPVGNGYNLWHSGSLPGTSTLLVRRHDGISWVVLFNTRDTPSGKGPSAIIDPLLHRAADEVTHWPDS